MIDAAQAAIQQAHRTDLDAASVLERTEAAIYGIAEREQRGDMKPAEVVVAETWPMLERIMEQHRSVTGVPSGFTDLDRTLRGFQPSNLILAAGRTSMGKTAFMLNMALHAATQGEATTALFSLEMSEKELMIRLLTAAGRLDSPSADVRYLPESQYEQLARAMYEVTASRLGSTTHPA